MPLVKFEVIPRKETETEQKNAQRTVECNVIPSVGEKVWLYNEFADVTEVSHSPFPNQYSEKELLAKVKVLLIADDDTIEILLGEHSGWSVSI